MTYSRVRLGHVAVIRNGGTPSADTENWDGGVPFITPPDLRGLDGSVVEETGRSLTPEGAARGSTLVDRGVILSCRAPIGYVGRVSHTSAFNQGCKVLQPEPGLDDRFLAYVLLSERPALEVLGRGTTFMELAASELASLQIPLPAVAEQRRIADYLDRETAMIDTLIEKQRSLIDLLQYRREAVIAEVISGFGSTTKIPIKRLLRKVVTEPWPDAPVVTAFRDGQVVSRADRRVEGFTESLGHAGYQRVEQGQLVFHGLDGFAGAVGVSESDGKCSPVYHVCDAIGEVDLVYMALQLRALGAAGFLQAYAWSVRQRSVDYRNWDTFAALRIMAPSLAEQSEIVRHIRRETAKIDTLIAKAERFIELAQERRAALITAAVTGQVEIPAEESAA